MMTNQQLFKRWNFLLRLTRLGLALALVAAVVVGVLPVPVARAATINVDITTDTVDNDDGHCSLREAITAANTNTASGSAAGECAAGSAGPTTDTITLPPGIYTLTKTGDDGNAQGDLDILGGGNLTINGAGASATIINGPTGNDRIFHIQALGYTVNISGVTIQNGNALAYGGGIAISNGTLNIANSIIYNNTTAMGGGAIAISGDSALNIINTTIYSNAATGDHDGGGILNLNRTVTITGSTIYTNTARYGGGIVNDNGGTVVITNTTVDDNEASRGGGGIVNWDGTVTIANSTFSNNRAVDDGGGGILNETSSTMNIANSTLSNNYTTRFGGGISSDGPLTVTNTTLSGNKADAGGGGIYNTDAADLTNVTIANNIADYDNNNSGSGGGIDNNTGTINMANSTLSNNQTNRYGGGISSDSPLTITNSTFSGNKAGRDGGGIYSSDTTDLTNVTITNNTADYDNDTWGSGGGISNDFAGTANLINTIVAGNFDTPGNAGASTIRPDLNGSFNGAAYNLIGDLTGSSGTVGTGSDIVSTTPGLGPLADNGGDTQTHALLSGSPAIDAVPEVSCPLATDQRGVSRPQGDACDIGAYEVAPNAVYLPLILKGI